MPDCRGFDDGWVEGSACGGVTSGCETCGCGTCGCGTCGDDICGGGTCRGETCGTDTCGIGTCGSGPTGFARNGDTGFAIGLSTMGLLSGGRELSTGMDALHMEENGGSGACVRAEGIGCATGVDRDMGVDSAIGVDRVMGVAWERGVIPGMGMCRIGCETIEAMGAGDGGGGVELCGTGLAALAATVAKEAWASRRAVRAPDGGKEGVCFWVAFVFFGKRFFFVAVSRERLCFVDVRCCKRELSESMEWWHKMQLQSLLPRRVMPSCGNVLAASWKRACSSAFLRCF